MTKHEVLSKSREQDSTSAPSDKFKLKFRDIQLYVKLKPIDFQFNNFGEDAFMLCLIVKMIERNVFWHPDPRVLERRNWT